MQLPNIFGGSPEGIETFCNLLPQNATASDPVTLDFSQVPWIRPYGALMLLLACQHPHQQTNLPVQLIRVPLGSGWLQGSISEAPWEVTVQHVTKHTLSLANATPGLVSWKGDLP
jgi:hypothetical protein